MVEKKTFHYTKIFFIYLQVQLIVTLGMIFLFTYHGPTREFAMKNQIVFWLALILVFITIITLSCCEGVRRTAPHNFIALGLFTLGESYMVGMSTLRFESDLVIHFFFPNLIFAF